jgi:hypothetical protein
MKHHSRFKIDFFAAPVQHTAQRRVAQIQLSAECLFSLKDTLMETGSATLVRTLNNK